MGGLSRRWLAALAGGAVVLVAVGTALLFVGPLSGSGEKPPETVQQALARLGAGEDAELAAERLTAQGTVKLWAASSEAGVGCYLLEFVEARRGEGVCPSRQEDRLPLFLVRSRTELRDQLELLHGKVADGVTSLVLGFNDGRRQRVAVADGFVLHEVIGPEPGFVIAIDEEAGPVGLVGSRAPLFRGGLASFFGRRTPVELTTRSGEEAALTLTVGGRGTHCRQVEVPRVETIRCTPQLARGITFRRTYVGPLSKGSVFLDGLVGEDVHALRIRFADGAAAPVEFVANAFLYEVRPGRAPEALVGLDGRGRVVAEAPL